MKPLPQQDCGNISTHLPSFIVLDVFPDLLFPSLLLFSIVAKINNYR